MPTNTSIPVIDLGYVKYAGYRNATAGINCCRGIPYTQPPLGDPRWRKPRPIETSNNFGGQTINATKISSVCYQSLPLWSYLRPGSHNGSKFEAHSTRAIGGLLRVGCPGPCQSSVNSHSCYGPDLWWRLYRRQRGPTRIQAMQW